MPAEYLQLELLLKTELNILPYLPPPTALFGKNWRLQQLLAKGLVPLARRGKELRPNQPLVGILIRALI